MTSPDETHRLVQRPLDLEAMVRELEDSDIVAFDTETNGLEWFRGKHPIGVSFASDRSGRSVSWYVPFCHVVPGVQLPTDSVRGAVERVFRKVPIVGHNAKFDMHFASRIGVKSRPVVHDTMVLARLANEHRPSLAL